MASTSRTDRTLFIAAGLLAVVFLINLFLGQTAGLIAFQALRPITVLAFAICLFAAFRHNIARRALEEERDLSVERDERTDSALFEKGEIEPFTIRRTHHQLERFVVALFTLIAALFAGFRALRFFGVLGDTTAHTGVDLLLVLSFLLGEAFFLFLFSRYLIGLSRNPDEKYARGAGIAIGLVCLGAVAGAMGALVGHLVHPYADVVVGYVLTLVLLLLSIEFLLTLLIAVYSPRRSELISTSYHSRFGGMLTDPAGWVKSFTHALDYQFGFNISETWFYKMLQRTVVPLLVAVGLVVFLMSCFVFLQPEEAGVLERFGKPVEGKWRLESGFHLKWPWPVEKVRRLPANRILSIQIGHEMEPGKEPPEIILWTRRHFMHERRFVVASGTVAEEDRGAASAFGLVSVNVPVKYSISNLKEYLYGFQDPGRVVRLIGEKILVQALAEKDLNNVLAADRAALGLSIREAMQKEADALSIGVTFDYVGLQGIHPPTEVAEAFEDVVGALLEKESAILAARSYQASAIPDAKARAFDIEVQAETNKTRRVELARANAERFGRQRNAFRAAPEVYKSEIHLNVLRENLKDTRLIVIDRPGSEVFEITFDESILPDIFNLDETVREGDTP